MYAYERFNGILKSFVRNQAFPEGSMVQECCIEEAVEWTLNYANSSNSIGVPKSRHEGRLTGKWAIRKKVITPDPQLFCYAHFHVLQQMSTVSEYLDERMRCCLETIYNRTTSGRVSSTRISLSDSRWSENTINTHKYNTKYCSSSRRYYNLGSHISYIERGLKPKLRFRW
jgi:hypothetical protein